MSVATERLSFACPVCDIDQIGLTPIEVLALGIAVERARGGGQLIGEMTCSKHRTPLILAMSSLAAKLPVGR